MEHAHDGGDAEYRAKFDGSFGPLGDDIDSYLREVWLDHLSQLVDAKAA